MHTIAPKKQSTTQDNAHGGDLLRMAKTAGRTAQSLIDFSVNVRPDGPPSFITDAIHKAMQSLTAYPSPHAEEAQETAALHYGLPRSCFVFGNGSNELIHAVGRALRHAPCALIIEPAFSEYDLACQRANLAIERAYLLPSAQNTEATSQTQQASMQTQIQAPMQRIVDAAPHGAVLFFANPSNPAGLYCDRTSLLNFIAQRPDIVWIIDEAFIEYVGDESEHSLLNAPTLCDGTTRDDTKPHDASPWPDNLIVLRSLTKFHAIPSVRVGFLVAGEAMAQRIHNELSSWNLNAFAIASACAVLEDTSDFAPMTRADNASRRANLEHCLRAVQGLEIMPSVANYVLFRWPLALELNRVKQKNLPTLLLQEYGIALRDCSNYHGLEDGSWFRVAVRFPHEHAKLGAALQALAADLGQASHDYTSHTAHAEQDKSLESPAIILPRKSPALMLQGTSSNAGKSILVAAFCRIARQDGYDVAPFKAQNMSLNSGVTPLGDEMGRAQIVQAQAARVIPDARMNPILLKPHSETGSQVIVLGKSIGHMGVREYFAKKPVLWEKVHQSYDSLAKEHDLMILEGAGSPAEINLKASDVVNMRMAAHAKAAVLLVGDIDRGGVYASFLGTWMTFSPEERRLLHGFVVNRFRGDASLLDPAHEYMLAQTGVPVVGVVPYMRNLNLPEEDMAGFDWDAKDHGRMHAPNGIATQEQTLDIAVIMLRHISNYTDMEPLTMEPDVTIRPVRHVHEWCNENGREPDLVLIPGSKSVTADLTLLRESGLAERIVCHANQGGWLIGICGGLQILGEQILDPQGIESSQKEVQGLGLMELSSSFASQKTLTLVHDVASPLGVPCKGYEIHHGITKHGPRVTPIEHNGHHVTYVQERRWASYLHGIFDDDAFRRTFIDHVRVDLGLRPQGRILAHYDIDAALDALADTVRQSVDIPKLYSTLGLR